MRKLNHGKISKNGVKILIFAITLVGIFSFTYLVLHPKTLNKSLGAAPGDCDGDGFVNGIDFQLLSNTFGKLPGQTGYDVRCDFNGDTFINALDYQALSNNFGAVTPTPTPVRTNTATPRPTNTPTPAGPTPTLPPIQTGSVDATTMDRK